MVVVEEVGVLRGCLHRPESGGGGCKQSSLLISSDRVGTNLTEQATERGAAVSNKRWWQQLPIRVFGEGGAVVGGFEQWRGRGGSSRVFSEGVVVGGRLAFSAREWRVAMCGDGQLRLPFRVFASRFAFRRREGSHERGRWWQEE